MKRFFRRAAGFSLVEVTLALGIAAFSLIAIFGLLPIASQVTRTATERTSSSNVLATIAADLRAAAPTASTSPIFGISIPSSATAPTSTVTLYFTATGESSTSLTGTSRYRATVTFVPNPAGANTATLATVTLTWPAAASVANAAGSSGTFVALARN